MNSSVCCVGRPWTARPVGLTRPRLAPHRRSVIVSVLESLRVNLKIFNLASVLQEVGRWMHEGISLFARQWQAVQAELATAANTS